MKKIIMVMGHQRSGTNAVFKSLSADKSLINFNEDEDSRVFCKWSLRTEREIRYIFQNSEKPILLKPVTETNFRSIVDIFVEYENYDLWVVYIYRDPINVLNSHNDRQIRLNMPQRDPGEFIQSWNGRNRYILEALPRYGERIAIIRYEDIVQDPQIFHQINIYLGLNGEYLFRQDSNRGRKNIPMGIQNMIDEGTKKVLAELDANRRFKPAFSGSNIGTII